MAIDLAARQQAEIVLATDPDADRIGMALRRPRRIVHLAERQPDMRPARILYRKKVERTGKTSRPGVHRQNDRYDGTGRPNRRIVRRETFRMPDRLQVYRHGHPQPRRENAVRLRRRRELRISRRRFRPRQGRRQRLFAGRRRPQPGPRAKE